MAKGVQGVRASTEVIPNHTPRGLIIVNVVRVVISHTTAKVAKVSSVLTVKVVFGIVKRIAKVASVVRVAMGNSVLIVARAVISVVRVAMASSAPYVNVRQTTILMQSTA